jgi:O-acetyl-ADP-ribose deacetylase (regulator of RNase III)
MSTTIKILRGDITDLEVDAIVNAANESLLGGGGVDGAIHKAAGPELLEECKKIGGCPTGDVKITRGYNLKAKYIIHTVGPVWKDGNHNEEEILSNCYKRSLELATKNNIKTLAIPAISTGVYGFPKELAAEIALKELRNFNGPIDTIYLVAYDQENFDIFKKIF